MPPVSFRGKSKKRQFQRGEGTVLRRWNCIANDNSTDSVAAAGNTGMYQGISASQGGSAECTAAAHRTAAPELADDTAEFETAADMSSSNRHWAGSTAQAEVGTAASVAGSSRSDIEPSPRSLGKGRHK